MLMLRRGGVPADAETPNEDSSENGQEITNVHCHDSQHTK